jgi:Spy/CpxP family protein refolding chaperone
MKTITFKHKTRKEHVMLNKNLNVLAAGLLLLFLSSWIQAQEQGKDDDDLKTKIFSKEVIVDDDDDDALAMMGGPGMDFQFDMRDGDDMNIGGRGPCGGMGSGSCDRMGRGPMGLIHRFADELKLTKEQIDQIKTLHQGYVKKNIPLHSDLQLKHVELKELMDTDKPDKGKVEAKIKDIESVRTKIHVNRLNEKIDVQDILTKEQKEQLEKMKFERPMRHKPMKRKFRWFGE